FAVFGVIVFFFFSSRRRHTRFSRDWSSDVCSSDLARPHREAGGSGLPARERKGGGAAPGDRPCRTAGKDPVMSYPSRPADLPPTVNCPYCLSHIDTSRARRVIRNIATQEVVDDVTDAVRRRGLLGVASYDRGNIYLECRREVRLDLVQGEYDYPGTADPLDDMTTVVMNRPGEDSPTAAFTDGIGFDDPEEDESAGPSPFSLADDADEDGDGWESTTGAQPSPP